ncbi:MAG: hypothetical protein KatS3mg003_0292 [Candidatus Nitrosocaldaceae archaeon]|nr:MAG: hypothetical protein KatS3mg003_0292 [Candidatus Nitrosocaldaceae archaeon]
MGILKVTRVSKPLIIAAVIFLFIGSSIGALLMMLLFGFKISIPFDILRLHRIIQIDGFLTLLIMGIGYMLMPRFRNIDNPKPYQVYIPFTLVLSSLILYIINYEMLADVLILAGVVIFSLYIINTTRVKPRLLPISDYYIMLAISALISINIIKLFDMQLTLQYIQLWLLFPLFMILGVEYKTLPSFIGYINPRMNYTKLSLILGVLALSIGIASLVIDLAVIFSMILLATIAVFDKAVYATHGFDYREILERLNGEELARYKFTLLHIRLSYLFLYSALISSILYHLTYTFALYDLSIHLMTIGFMGLTIKLYLPMMLPPIIGRVIKFQRFNLIPLYLLLIALGLRIIGMFLLASNNELLLIIGASGWLIIIALFLYARMIHKSMGVRF